MKLLKLIAEIKQLSGNKLILRYDPYMLYDVEEDTCGAEIVHPKELDDLLSTDLEIGREEKEKNIPLEIYTNKEKVEEIKLILNKYEIPFHIRFEKFHPKGDIVKLIVIEQKDIEYINSFPVNFEGNDDDE